MRGGSIGTRLATVVAATVAGAVLVVAAGTFGVVAVQLHRDQDVALLREATRVQRSLQDGGTLASGGTCEYVGQPACARIVDAGSRVGSGTGPLRSTAEALRVARGEVHHAYATVDAPAGRTRSSAVRTLALRVYPGRAVVVGIPTSATERTIARTGVAMLGTGAVGVLLAAVVGLVAARSGLRPVRDLEASIRRVTATRNPNDHVVAHRDDELGRLATSFSTMLSELAAAQEAQRRFVADASHELRTPITTLRTNLTLLRRPLPEGTRARLQDAVDRELDEVQGLVADLLDLAHGEDHDPGADLRDPVDLTAVGREAVERAARHWPDAGFRLRSEGPDAVVHGDRDRLARLVDVLLDNAGKHGGPGDVEVVVARRPTGPGAEVVLTVADRGPGIAEEDRPHVFDRFYRSRAARGRPGSGLGLAIASQIVTGADGMITALPRDGGGTVMRVMLPAV